MCPVLNLPTDKGSKKGENKTETYISPYKILSKIWQCSIYIFKTVKHFIVFLLISNFWFSTKQMRYTVSIKEYFTFRKIYSNLWVASLHAYGENMDKMQLGAIYGWKYEANIITLFFFFQKSFIVVFGILSVIIRYLLLSLQMLRVCVMGHLNNPQTTRYLPHPTVLKFLHPICSLLRRKCCYIENPK